MWHRKRKLGLGVQKLWEDKKPVGKGFHDKLFNEANLDGTGPEGKGPKTGRGEGLCEASDLNLSPKEMDIVKAIIDGEDDLLDYEDLYKKIHDKWEKEMPSKLRTGDYPEETAEWIFRKLETIFGEEKDDEELDEVAKMKIAQQRKTPMDYNPETEIETRREALKSKKKHLGRVDDELDDIDENRDQDEYDDMDEGGLLQKKRMGKPDEFKDAAHRTKFLKSHGMQAKKIERQLKKDGYPVEDIDSAMKRHFGEEYESDYEDEEELDEAISVDDIKNLVRSFIAKKTPERKVDEKYLAAVKALVADIESQNKEKDSGEIWDRAAQLKMGEGTEEEDELEETARGISLKDRMEREKEERLRKKERRDMRPGQRYRRDVAKKTFGEDDKDSEE